MTYLTYIFPAFIDVVVALVCFVNAVRLAQFGLKPATVAGVFTALNLVYMVANLIVGRIVNTRNAMAIMLTGCALYLSICVSFMMISSVEVMFFLVGATGVAGSMFFLPFQVFMKGKAQEANTQLHVSIGIYNMAWSLGFATGPFIAGFLMELGLPDAAGEKCGWRYAYIAAALLVITTAAGLLLFNSRKKPVAGAVMEPAKSVNIYREMPDIVWLGWLAMATLAMIFYSSRGLLTSRFTNDLHLPSSTQGMLFFAASVAQAMTSLALCLSRTWMYRALPVAAFPVAGALGLIIFGTAETPLTLYAATILIGIYAGGVFCYSVFHSVVHPTRSASYVSINEASLGASGALSPVIAGLTVTAIGFSQTFYAGSIILLAVMAVQIYFHSRIKIAIPD